jgi:hypothetical protein
LPWLLLEGGTGFAWTCDRGGAWSCIWVAARFNTRSINKITHWMFSGTVL